MRRAVKRCIVLLEFLIAHGILPGCVWSVPTVGVSGGLPREPTNETDNVFEQKNALNGA
jgi:hypothetical protein